MNVLQVYLASHCLGYNQTAGLIANLRQTRPDLQVQVINIDDDSVQIPEIVFGTPIYVLNERIISLGNPSEEELLTQVGPAPPPRD